jgi:hypothetical protein
MVRLVREWDPLFFEKVGLGAIDSDDLPEGRFPQPKGGGRPLRRTVRRAAQRPMVALRDASIQSEEIVADSVRSIFGLTPEEMTDDEAIDRVMNPASNRYRLDILNVSYHSPLMRSLHHVNYVFEKRLSHTADSQDQRHRMVPASRPLMTFADTAQPDYITPRLIAANPRAGASTTRHAGSVASQEPAAAARRAARVRALRAAERQDAALRRIGSLLALLHKWTLRTCFNAQEEIYLASMDEIEQVARVHPRSAGTSARLRHPQRI